MTTVSNKQLIAAVSKSSKYYLYEVEDVLEHLVKVLKQELCKGNSIRIAGIGRLNIQKLKNKGQLSAKGEKVCYNSYRLSVISDSTLKEHLKENYIEPTESTTKMAVSNVQ